MRLAFVMLAAVLAAPLAGQKTQPRRDDLAAIERSLDEKLSRFNPSQPMDLLGLTRGIYLPGFGAVFTAEVGLIQGPILTPFRPRLTKEEVTQIRTAKLKRLPEMKLLMKEMLLASAASLDTLPPGESVVLGVTFINNKWEDTTGLPKSITMQARRAELLEVAQNRQPKSALDTLVQMREE